MPFAQDLRRILSLALPVVIAELGWMGMSVVDTIMAGWLGAPAIGAVSVGNALIEVAALVGIGLLLGLDTMVSHSFGAGRTEECAEWLWQSIYMAAIAAPLLMAAMWTGGSLLVLAGVDRAVLDLAPPYVGAMTWSLPPLLLYAALRRYLQGMSQARPVMFVLVTANLVNAAGNWLLMQRYGVAGIGWSTCISRIYMAGVLAGFALVRDPSLLRRIPRPEPERVRRLLELGLPASMQLLLEIGVFATATVLAGKLAPESLAAHQIALNIAGTTFMVPLGVSSAGAVAVGQALGAGDPRTARRDGWLALALGAGFMAFAGLALATAPRLVLWMFTRDPAILAVAVPLLLVAAIFQLFDGIQVTATGILRGAGNTRTPMVANLLGHWGLGLPLGYLLCFRAHWGVAGLWTGFSLGLCAVAARLLAAWSRMRLGPAKQESCPNARG